MLINPRIRNRIDHQLAKSRAATKKSAQPHELVFLVVFMEDSFGVSCSGSSTRLSSSHKVVSIRSLKAFALKMPKSHSLRHVLMLERDILTIEEFIAKMETWLTLLEAT